MPHYAPKTDIKNVPYVQNSHFALQSNLANLKTEVNKLDVDKLVSALADLSKLKDVVKNEVVKKTVYDKLVAKVNSIDTSAFVLKTKYDTDKKVLENKIHGTNGHVKKIYYNTKITKIEGKLPSIGGLATFVALTAVEIKMPIISNLVEKSDYSTKITEIEKKLTDHYHEKYITTPEFNTLAVHIFNVRLAQANLVTKTDFDVKLSSLNRKITSNKTKDLLVQNELKRIKTFVSSYFIDKSHSEEDGTQNYYVFQPMFRYFKIIVGRGSGNYIYY